MFYPVAQPQTPYILIPYITEPSVLVLGALGLIIVLLLLDIMFQTDQEKDH
jgi:hypothetical protein